MTKIGSSNKRNNNQALGAEIGVTQKMSTDNQLNALGSLRQNLLNRLEPNGKNRVNEDELFAAIVFHEVKELHGRKAVKAFNEHYEEFLGKKVANRQGSEEFATNRALKKTRLDGFFSAEDAQAMRNQAYTTAQIDGNPYKTYTDSGRARASLDVNEAIQNAQDAMDRVLRGEQEVLNGTQRRAAHKIWRAVQDDIGNDLLSPARAGSSLSSATATSSAAATAASGFLDSVKDLVSRYEDSFDDDFAGELSELITKQVMELLAPDSGSLESATDKLLQSDKDEKQEDEDKEASDS